MIQCVARSSIFLPFPKRSSSTCPGSYELNYEDLVSEPLRYLRETLDFCELPWNRSFEEYVRSRQFHNYQDKWKKTFSEEVAGDIFEFFRRANGEGSDSHA